MASNSQKDIPAGMCSIFLLYNASSTSRFLDFRCINELMNNNISEDREKAWICLGSASR